MLLVLPSADFRKAAGHMSGVVESDPPWRPKWGDGDWSYICDMESPNQWRWLLNLMLFKFLLKNKSNSNFGKVRQKKAGITAGLWLGCLLEVWFSAMNTDVAGKVFFFPHRSKLKECFIYKDLQLDQVHAPEFLNFSTVFRSWGA